MPYILSLLVLWCCFAPAFPIPFPTLLRLDIYEIYVQPFSSRLQPLCPGASLTSQKTVQISHWWIILFLFD